MLTARRRWVAQQLEDELERESELLQQQQQPRKSSNNSREKKKTTSSKPLRRRRIVVASSSKSVGFATMSASAFSVVEGGSNGRSHRSENGDEWREREEQGGRKKRAACRRLSLFF